MLIDDFNQTLDVWTEALDRYTMEDLCARPSPASWSIGQVYVHLIRNTQYYIGQIILCASSSENADEQPLPAGASMLSKNEFPEILIEGPDTNVDIPQPSSIIELKNELLLLKDEMNEAADTSINSRHRGKTKHPGLGYFDANDWLRFSEMHFRHHLRQRKRIEEFLEGRRKGFGNFGIGKLGN